MTLFNYPIQVYRTVTFWSFPVRAAIPGITAEQYLLHGDYFVSNSLASQTNPIN